MVAVVNYTCDLPQRFVDHDMDLYTMDTLYMCEAYVSWCFVCVVSRIVNKLVSDNWSRLMACLHTISEISEIRANYSTSIGSTLSAAINITTMIMTTVRY